MFKNIASQKIAVYAYDATTGAPKTGDAANITCYLSKDFGSVTSLADTSATEMDATNAKGMYLFDVSQTESNCDCAIFTGKSATSNIYIAPQTIYTDPANYTTFSIDGNGRVDVIKLAGTTQTARDLGLSVLLSSGTGTGQLDFTSGVVKANLAQILGTALTETAGQIAAAFKQWFNVAAPVGTVNSIPNATAGAAGGLFIAGINAATTITTGLTTHFIGTVDTVTTYTGNTPQTGDGFLRLGAPAGASVSADIAAIKSDTGTILTDVNTGAGAIYTRIGAPAGASIAADIAGLNNISTAQVKTQVVAALNTDTYAEPAQGTPAATTTLAAKINYLFKAWRNKTTQDGTTYKLFNDDTATVDHKAAVSDDGTTFTRGEVATGP